MPHRALVGLLPLVLAVGASAQERLAGALVEVVAEGRSGPCEAAALTTTSWAPHARYVERIDAVGAEGRPTRLLRQVIGGPRLELTLLDPAASRWRVTDAESREQPADGLQPLLETCVWLRAASDQGALTPAAGTFDACAPGGALDAAAAWPDLPPCVLALLRASPPRAPVVGGRWSVAMTRLPAPGLAEVTASVTLRLGRPAPGVADPSWSAERVYGVQTSELRVRVARAKTLPGAEAAPPR